MMIVDAQVHMWGENTPDRPWPPGRGKPHRPKALYKAELLAEMDAAGVDRVIIVPPKWEGDRNDLALDAVQSHPQRFAIMGRLDPDLPESRGKLATWRQQPGMLGLRYSLTAPEMKPILLEGRLNWLWAEAERVGVPVYVLVTHSTCHLIDEVAERHPGLKITMDHLALDSSFRDEACFRDLDKLLALAKRPNIAVKSSALPGYTTDAYPYRSLDGYIRRVYDAFGPKRMFWGSDFTRLPCTYRQCVTHFTEELPWLSAEDKEWIMGRAVCEWLGWKV